MLRAALREELRAQLGVVGLLAAVLGVLYALCDDVDQVVELVDEHAGDLPGVGASSPT